MAADPKKLMAASVVGEKVAEPDLVAQAVRHGLATEAELDALIADCR